jgi:hypothetical protein
MDLPDGYISIDSVTGQKGVITHFAVAVDHMDRVAAKRLADKINSELPDAKARDAYQANTGGSTVNLRDPTASSYKSRRRTGANRQSEDWGNGSVGGRYCPKVVPGNLYLAPSGSSRILP